MKATTRRNAVNKTYNLDELADLREGRLSLDKAAAVQAQLRINPQATAAMQWLERTWGHARTDDSIDPPQQVVQQVLRMFDWRAVSPKPNLLQRLVAVLQFDSVQTPLAYGVRSGLPASRQMLYNAPPYDVDLRIAPTNGNWRLAGQVLGPCMGGQVALQGVSSVDTTLNELCEFTIPAVPAGLYSLVLRLDDIEVAIDTLPIGN